MSTLNEALQTFDLGMDEAVTEAEAHLRTGGATEREIEEFRGWFMPEWSRFVEETRAAIVRAFTEVPSRASH